MALYLKSKKKAMKKYPLGDFIMQGSRVVQYVGEKGADVSFPDEAVGIGEYTFSKAKPVKKITIPKDIHMEPMAFAGCKSDLITFEEGRTKISKYALCGLDKSNEMTVCLPKSTRVIEENALFYSYDYGPKKARLILNDGLEEIQSEGIYGLEVELPGTIRKMESNAYGCPVNKVKLPEGISGLEKGCINFLHKEECEGDDSDADYVVMVPASVDLGGKNIVVNGICEKEKK